MAAQIRLMRPRSKADAECVSVFRFHTLSPWGDGKNAEGMIRQRASRRVPRKRQPIAKDQGAHQDVDIAVR